MEVMAAVGLAQNFGAVKSLVTTGIQKGHMKLHLLNILNQLNANQDEVEKGKKYFSDKVVSFTGVREFFKYFKTRLGKCGINFFTVMESFFSLESISCLMVQKP
jgi:hydroxymethylglutaryl-CoA reductase